MFPIIQRFDGQGRAVAHDIWTLYGSLGPAHGAAHVFLSAGPGRGQQGVAYYCNSYLSRLDRVLEMPNFLRLRRDTNQQISRY